MSKAAKIRAFDPNSPGDANAQMYGLPFTCEEADIVLMPVPWEVTTSYGGGTAHGPQAIFDASFQVDLFHPEFPDLWKRGVAMDEMPKALLQQSKALKKEAHKVITMLTEGGSKKELAQAKKALELVNAECAVMNEWVEARAGEWLDAGKLVGLVGGDHSTPLGYFRAQAKRHRSFGILHIDAHMDLRERFEGFESSHASIMHRVVSHVPGVVKLVQFGIRDFGEGEWAFAREHGADREDGRIRVYFDDDVSEALLTGREFHRVATEAISLLPEKVYVSFDIDGLDPSLCPHTGTPVPGGLSFQQASSLLGLLKASGKRVVGMDLVEVAPGTGKDDPEWDANVGARVLYRMCGLA